MTNKDLSRQLAELVELKPVYTLLVDFGDLDHDIQKVYNKRKWRLIADYRGEVPDDELLASIKEELPNFEIPENFVNLLECVYSFSDGFNNLEKHQTFMLDFLSALLANFKEADLDNLRFNELKQALQATEWVY